MNLPNKLTIFRIILVPVFMLMYNVGNGIALSCMGIFVTWGELLAVLVFVIASVTDWADGYIARKYKLITNFGKFMDPLADKLLISGALCCLLASGVTNEWIVMIILAREFMVTGLRLIAASAGVVIAAGKLGKIKTVIQMITVICAIIIGKCVFVDILFYLSAVITALSGIVYLVRNRGLLVLGE